MFLGFANFYRRFIQGFSRIAATFTLMLKTSKSTESTSQPKEGVVGIGGDRKARYNRSKLNRNETDNNGVNSNEVDDEIGKKSQKTSKSKNLSKSKILVKFKKTLGLDFLTLRAKLAFIKLKQAFLKVLILHQFNLERHIRIKTDISSYAIGGVLSQPTLKGQ